MNRTDLIRRTREVLTPFAAIGEELSNDTDNPVLVIGEAECNAQDFTDAMCLLEDLADE
jgi:hypothetical protein